MSSARLDALRIPDRHDIEKVMYDYTRAADHADARTQVDLFIEDCRVSYRGGVWIEGREALFTSLENAFARYRQTSHQVSNISITFTGTDTATADSVLTAWHRGVDGKEWTLHGRYVDTWIKGMAGWKLATREIRAAGAIGRDEAELTMLRRLTLSDGH